MSLGAKIVEIQYFTALALQVTIAVAMLRRRMFLHARYFFVYIVWQTFSVACTYVIMHEFPPPSTLLFYAWWINNAVDIVLAMAILIEIFNRIFAPYEAIRRVGRILFISAAVVLTAFAAIFLLYRHVEYSVPILTVFMVAERSIRILQLGLILSLFAITRYLHLRWKNYLFGIALGFGFYAITVLAVLVVRMTYGEPVMKWASVLEGTGYCIAVLIWTSYVLQPEVASVPIVFLPSFQLQQWDTALMQILARR